MTFALVGLVVVVLGFHVWQARQWAAERAMLVKAVLARSPEQFAAMTVVSRPKREREEPDVVQVGI